MIIKSMSRTSPSFGQLFDYIGRKAHPSLPPIAWNLGLADPSGREAVLGRFLDNARLLRTRKDGNVLFHEIISLQDTRTVPREELCRILYDLAHEYLNERALHLLAYGALHDDHQEHIHLHLMLSANEVGSENRFRLSKFRFHAIQHHCEAFLARHHPELAQKPVFLSAPDASAKNPSRVPAHLARRQAIARTVGAILDQKTTHTTLPLGQRLARAGFEVFERGETSLGVICSETGRRYRFAALGLLDLFRSARDQDRSFLAAREQLQSFRRLQPVPNPEPDPSWDWNTEFLTFC